MEEEIQLRFLMHISIESDWEEIGDPVGAEEISSEEKRLLIETADHQKTLLQEGTDQDLKKKSVCFLFFFTSLFSKR